jgi:hypothetical protein
LERCDEARIDEGTKERATAGVIFESLHVRWDLRFNVFNALTIQRCEAMTLARQIC